MKSTDQSNHNARRLSLTWIAAIFLGCAGGGLHAEEAAPAKAPKIKFDHLRHDFGRVRSGAIMKHEFTFTNAGNADLVITNVIPACGCTTMEEYESLIPPGGKGSLPLEFNSTGQQGAVQKTLLVQSNDPVQPSAVLTIVGFFWQPVELYPAVAVMQLPPHTDQTLSTTIRIVNQMEDALELKTPVSSVPELRARVEQVTPGKEFHLIVDTVPPFAHKDIQGTITMATSSKGNPQVQVAVIVIAQPEITVSPTQLYLPAVPPDFPEPYVINIRNKSPEGITIDNASCDIPGSKVEIREKTAGRDFSLSVTIPPDFRNEEGKVYGITANTSLASQPQLNIPVAFAAPHKANPPHKR